MKKAIAILSAAMTTAALAGSITTSNEMGFLPVSPVAAKDKEKYKMMLAIPFENYGSAGSNINVSEIILTSTLAEGDKLYVANAGGYDVYTLKSDGTWDPATKVTVAEGQVETPTTPSATTATIARGQAVWLETSATTVNLMGQVPAGAVSGGVAVTGGQTAFKYNLVGASTSAKVALTAAFGANGDRVILADGTTYARNNDTWMKIVKVGTQTTLVGATNTELPAGTGFWYLAKGSDKKLSM